MECWKWYKCYGFNSFYIYDKKCFSAFYLDSFGILMVIKSKIIYENYFQNKSITKLPENYGCINGYSLATISSAAYSLKFNYWIRLFE